MLLPIMVIGMPNVGATILDEAAIVEAQTSSPVLIEMRVNSNQARVRTVVNPSGVMWSNIEKPHIIPENTDLNSTYSSDRADNSLPPDFVAEGSALPMLDIFAEDNDLSSNILRDVEIVPHVNPMPISGHVVVPAGFVSQRLGITPAFNTQTQTATMTYRGITVTMPIGSKAATRTQNGVTMPLVLPVPAILVNNNTMIPARVVLEALGFPAPLWGGTNHTILIATQLTGLGQLMRRFIISVPQICMCLLRACALHLKTPRLTCRLAQHVRCRQ